MGEPKIAHCYQLIGSFFPQLESQLCEACHYWKSAWKFWNHQRIMISVCKLWQLKVVTSLQASLSTGTRTQDGLPHGQDKWGVKGPSLIEWHFLGLWHNIPGLPTGQCPPDGACLQLTMQEMLLGRAWDALRHHGVVTWNNIDSPWERKKSPAVANSGSGTRFPWFALCLCL